jgi:hypothetical protein
MRLENATRFLVIYLIALLHQEYFPKKKKDMFEYPSNSSDFQAEYTTWLLSDPVVVCSIYSGYVSGTYEFHSEAFFRM